MGKKHKCPEFENHERWLVSFADMMTLLFALFVVLFSLKDGSDAPEIDQAAGAIQESFNSVLEDIPADRRIGPTEAGFGIFEHMRGDSVRQPISPKFPTTKKNIALLEKDQDKMAIELEMRLYGPNKLPDPKKVGQERIVSVIRDSDGIRLRLLASHFYRSGSYKIRKQAVAELKEIAKIVKEFDKRITIEGHTDSMPTGGQWTNWELSSLRATHVLRYLVTEHNFPPSKMAASGYGHMRPIAHNGSESGRRLNRRIEIKLHYDD